jgi:hypothetical protein
MTTYTKTTWVDEIPDSTPVKYKITESIDGDITPSAKIEIVTGVTPGTPMNADNLNHMETGVYNAQVAADAAQATASAAIPKSLVTLAGDLIYATASAVLARLALGSAGRILRVNAAGTAPEWGAAIFTKVYRSTDQSIPNSADTSISFSTETTDTNNMWVVGSPTILTIPYAGLYVFGGHLSYAANATGRRETRLRVNASILKGTIASRLVQPSGAVCVALSTAAILSAGDTIDLTA